MGQSRCHACKTLSGGAPKLRAGRRALLCAYDALYLMACATLLMPLWTVQAYAYIDPSVMTYTIQAIAGVAVALSTVFGVFARRSRKKLLKILDIDEGARRVVEPPVARVVASDSPQADTSVVDAPLGNVVVVDNGNAVGMVAAESTAESSAEAAADTASDAADEASAPSRKRTRKPKRKYAPPWRERIVYALIACAFTVCTIFVFAPYEVVGGSSGSLVFTLADVWWVVALPAIGVIAVAALVLSLFRGRVFNVLLVLIASIGLAAYVQALFLNVGMPAADGGTIIWAEHTDMIIVSGIVWVAIIVISVVLSFFNRFRAQGVVGLLCAALFIVQAIGAGSLFIKPPASGGGSWGMDNLTHTNLVKQTETAITEQGLYTVSGRSNVIVFVLDTYDTTMLNQALRIDPNLLDEMTGFTNFTNCTGSMIPTRFAVPYMMTGELPRVGEDMDTYLAQRYSRSTFLDDVYEAGYALGLYTDSMQIGSLSEEEQHAITDKTVNMHRISSSTMDFTGMLNALIQIGLYRVSPWEFKYLFWYYTDQINGRIVSYDPDSDSSERVYTINDARYYQQLQYEPLTIEEDGATGSFRYIHLLGPHYPFNLDEEANDLGTDNSTQVKQAQGSMHIVSEYLRQLKQVGAYDCSTIIITADHGIWFLTPDPLTRTSTPIMLVKPANAPDVPVSTSTAPVSHYDYLPTIAEAMGLDKTQYGSGISMMDDIDPNRVRTYLTTDSIGLRGIGIREYEITGNALKFSNWHETGNYWTLNE